jgi:hypothetical protein
MRVTPDSFYWGFYLFYHYFVHNLECSTGDFFLSKNRLKDLADPKIEKISI